MYTAPHYRQEDQEKLLGFMRTYSFATLISIQNNRPLGTHLPFVTEKLGDHHLMLHSHMARANSQWQQAQEQEVLVIFQEPHAYISPSLYNKPQNVPTWNYTAVHVYGKLQLVEAPEAVFPMLEKMMQAYEPEYLLQWEQLPQDYKDRMVRGIVAFQIEPTEIQGKEKLSQNKALDERQRIAEHLKQNPDSTAATIGHMMDLTF